MNIQFGGAFVSARIPRLEGGMSSLEMSAALKSAEQEKDGFVKSGKAQRAEVVLLERGILPSLPKETGMLVVIATDEDADFYNHHLDKPVELQGLCADILYEAALETEKAEAANPKPDPVKISHRLEKPDSLEGDDAMERFAQAFWDATQKATQDRKEMISDGKATIANTMVLTPKNVPGMPENLMCLSVTITGKDAKEWNKLVELHDEHPDKLAFQRRIYEKALASEAAPPNA